MNWSGVAVVAVMLMACTTLDETAAGDESTRPACFYADDVRNFEVLDRKTLIVYAPGRSHAYRVTVNSFGNQLRFVDSIGFASSGRRICGFAGDVMRPAGYDSRDYAVLGVERLDEATLDYLLQVRDGAGESAPEPGESATAEIEPLDDDHGQVE